MSVTTFYTQATIDGLTNISADSIDTSTLTADSLDLSGNLSCYNINANNIIGNDLHLNGTLDIDENIILNTAGSYIEFGDGSVQTTAAIGQGVGVVRGYLNAYSSQDQLNLSTTAYNTMSFNNVDSHNQIDISGNTKIFFRKTGAYLILISVQCKKSDSGDDDIYFWFAKNGTDIADSNTLSTLSKNDDVDLVTINFGANFIAGDYIEIRWFSQDANLYLHYDTSQTINGVALPATPSVILSVEETNSNYNSLQDVDISGNLSVSGNLDVSGTITGNWNITDLHLTGNLTVDGSTNFVYSTPQTSILPTNNYDLTNKQYVDSQTSGAATALLASNNSWTGTNTFSNELTVIGTVPAKFRVETYTDTNIKSNYADITLDSINLNVVGTIDCNDINGSNIDCDAIQSTAITSGTANFTDNTGTTLLTNVLSYTGTYSTYTDFNPITGDSTAGYTYILFTGNGTLTYNGTSSTTKINYVALGAGGSSAGANQGALVSLNGGSSAGAMSGEYQDGSFNTIANSSLTITIGTAGNGGNGAFWTGTTYTAPTGASNGTNTTITGSMLTKTARCGDRQGTPSTSREHGQDASGAFTSGGNDYGYGNQSGTGSTTRPTSGEFSTAANRCIGGGGCYANQSGYITDYFTSGGSKRIDLYDGRYYYVFGGSSLATVNVEVSTPTGIYKYAKGADGPSGKYKASGGRNGCKGGPSCVMFYFPTSTTTTIPAYALSTKGFYNSGITVPAYDSGWFNAAAVNTLYTFTHNLNISLSYPPRVLILVSAVNNPVLGTNNVYEAQISQSVGNLSNPTNTGWGLNYYFYTANAIRVSTGNSGIYIDNGGTGVSITTGYIRVYIYL